MFNKVKGHFMFARIVFLSSFLFFTSCATYTKNSDAMRSSIYSEEYDEALKKIDGSDVAKKGRDKVLYHMERGSILYLQGKYPLAAQEWLKASDRIDELYTTSISSQAAAMTVNETFSDYEGESFERVLLPIFSALAYFSNSQPEKAIVEVRKAYQVLNVIKKDNEGKNSFSRDSFSHYLSGLIYEEKKEWDSAIIEYRQAIDDAEHSKASDSEVTLRPIAEALASVAEHRNRQEILGQLKKKYPNLTWKKQSDLQNSGEIYVVYEAGKAPLKESEDIVVPVAGDVVRISFPIYKDVSYYSKGANVFIDGKLMGRPAVLQDIGSIAKQALSDRRTRDLVRMAARVLAKDQASRAIGRAAGPIAQLIASIFGAATESADTRGWSTLPDTLQVLRVSVPADKEVTLRIQPDSGKPGEFRVRVGAGDKKLVRWRSFW